MIISQLKPQRILEIGSFEGRSTVYLAQEASKYNSVEINCIDTWEGGVEHSHIQMGNVEQIFHYNISEVLPTIPLNNSVSINTFKGYSHDKMIDLIAQGNAGKFDLIYVDGSHQAPDVLFDAVLAFKLARVGGVIIFDDYLYTDIPRPLDHYLLPKGAIDSFISNYQRKVEVLKWFPIYQLYVQKISD